MAALLFAPYPLRLRELEKEWGSYFPRARRWKRVRFSIFLCFFLRIRLRRFLINEPMAAPR